MLFCSGPANSIKIEETSVSDQTETEYRNFSISLIITSADSSLTSQTNNTDACTSSTDQNTDFSTNEHSSVENDLTASFDVSRGTVDDQSEVTEK